MKNQNVLLIIDAQYDFCNPKGSLFVDGADADMKRLSDWIKTNKNDIDHIAITMDSHPVNDISHPSFWQDSNGNFPDPYTPIGLRDIKEGRWTPRFFADKAIHYIESLENQGEFEHFIWPYHCLSGSRGAAIDENIMDALIEWARDGKFYDVITLSLIHI
jgi:nicotinamidase-related amidase